MGRIRLETLSDYDKHGCDLNIACMACGHEVVRTPSWFFERGILGAIRKLEKRLRCEKCKARAARVHSTSFGPSGGRWNRADWRDGLRRKG